MSSSKVIGKISKYAFLSKNKLNPQHIEETMSEILKSDESNPADPLLWKTLFKYDKWYSSSTKPETYSPAPIGLNSRPDACLFFASTPELYDAFEQKRTSGKSVKLYPYISNIFTCYSVCKNLEPVTGVRAPIFLLNDSNFAGTFKKNPFLLNSLKGVWLENLLNNVLKNISLEPNEKNVLLIPELFTQIGTSVLSQNPAMTKRKNIPKILPDSKILDLEVHYKEVDSNSIAFCYFPFEGEFIDFETPKIKLKELLEKSDQEQKILHHWSDKDEDLNPSQIHWEKAKNLINLLDSIEKVYKKFDVDKIRAKISKK